MESEVEQLVPSLPFGLEVGFQLPQAGQLMQVDV
jgi:hypothetical protein